MRLRKIVLRRCTDNRRLIGSRCCGAREPKPNLDERFSDQEKRQHEDAAFAQLQHVFFLDPALVVAWNRTVNEIAFAEDQFFTFKGVRAHAMMHIAMHDALNAVIPLYRQFAYRGDDFFAHPIAAAAQAAHDVVLSQYPGQQARLGAELANWLSRIPEDAPKARGITLGRQSAAAILALRADDGWDFQGTYTFSNELGAYQTTPPWNGFVFQPGFRFASLSASARPTSSARRRHRGSTAGICGGIQRGEGLRARRQCGPHA